jgi:hypothetical protein
MIKAVLAAVVVYLAIDAGSDRLLEPVGLGYLHAFIAMFCGMFVGGWLAGRRFVPVALLLALGFSLLSYVIVSQMRDQSLLSLVLEQHPMISVGSIVGALLGAWLGYQVASRRRLDAAAVALRHGRRSTLVRPRSAQSGAGKRVSGLSKTICTSLMARSRKPPSQ